ncbi:hypothetical protein F442_20763 [Phytophthora nicotianae P10297]|uniref:ISXO2-like transposase domain-containing protein n=1 Tax=Phytophthora nicotianae P10297 TaxID=1317064 RepID=W2Y4X7_PHYNI|nr:hypothetical protein F442_20763 [Phytophthora nicotianae P10297]
MAHNYNLLQLRHFDFSAVMEATTDESKAVARAMEVGLLERSMFCPQCAQPMPLNARKRYWRCCRKTRHADGKQEQFSIFVNSWFSKMKLELFPGVVAAVCVVHANTPAPSSAHGQRQREYGVSMVRCMPRPLLRRAFEWRVQGEGHIVEIDETSLKKKSKYGRGRTYQEFWLLGGVDRTTGRWFGRIVYDKRMKATLLPIIKKFIRPRTRIHSDMFASYVAERGSQVHTLANNRTLASMHYEHSWVNHTLHFVDPVSGTHMNTIEGLWEMHIKRHIKAMRGCSKKYLDGYIDEYMWRPWFFFSNVGLSR